MENAQDEQRTATIEITDELRMALRNIFTPYYSDIENVKNQLRKEYEGKGKNFIQEHDEYIKNLDYYYFILKNIKNPRKREKFEKEIDQKNR